MNTIFQDVNHYNYTAVILLNFTRKIFQRVYVKPKMNWLQF